MCRPGHGVALGKKVLGDTLTLALELLTYFFIVAAAPFDLRLLLFYGASKIVEMRVLRVRQ